MFVGENSIGPNPSILWFYEGDRLVLFLLWKGDGVGPYFPDWGLETVYWITFFYIVKSQKIAGLHPVHYALKNLKTPQVRQKKIIIKMCCVYLLQCREFFPVNI